MSQHVIEKNYFYILIFKFYTFLNGRRIASQDLLFHPNINMRRKNFPNLYSIVGAQARILKSILKDAYQRWQQSLFLGGKNFSSNFTFM